MEINILKIESAPMVMNATLSLIAHSHTLRCDAKQAQKRFKVFDRFMSDIDYFYLGDYLPSTFTKGRQPKYIEDNTTDGIPVINTLSIQNLKINVEACRYITDEDFKRLEDVERPKVGDVLLTMDGGTSIGKPVVFELEDEFAVDSHIAILRPMELSAKALVYLLASPIGQLQFQRAESGASGQTAVTEDDVRRFRFPAINFEKLNNLVDDLDRQLTQVAEIAEKIHQQELSAWDNFNSAMSEQANL